MKTNAHVMAIIRLYLDYRNNFLTVQCFADYYRLSIWQADILIKTGRQLNETINTNNETID